MRGRSSSPSPAGRLAAVELGEPLLELGDPLRERLDRLGDRVGQVDPVGVGALRPPAFDPDRVAGVADHGRAGRHVLDDDGVGADLGAVADRDRAEQLGAGADRDVVAQGRVALAALEAGAAERHPLVEGHPPADLGRLADHHAGAVVDEELGADLRRRVDLDPGDRAAQVGDHPRRQRHPGLAQRVGDAVGEQRLHTGPAGEDLEGRDALRGRVAVARGGDVGADLLDDASSSSIHGAKKGRDM